MRKVWYVWCLFSFLISGMGNLMAQSPGIHGIVVDEEEYPLPGATVKVKNAALGTVTDIYGNFTFRDISAGEMLVISFIGRKTVEVRAREGMRVILPLTSQELDEAGIQVGYGEVQRRALTGAVSSVGSKDIRKRPVTSVLSALEGMVTGVVVNNTYGQPGDSPEIRIRGFGSVNGENMPLYVVDGVPYAGELAEINPDDVESISVLKDASAAALYGNRAANGVIVITLKKARAGRLSLEFNIRQGIYSRGMEEYDCLGTDDFMEMMWKSQRNSLMTLKPKDYPTKELANAQTTKSLVAGFLKYNIYNLPDDRLFGAEGHLAEGAVVRDAIREDLDWFAPVERKGYRQEYNLSGGAVHEKSSYRFSLGYLDEKGFLKNAGFDRLTARLSVNHTPRKWLACGLSLAGSHHNQSITDGTGNTYKNVFNIARYVAPIYPVHLHDLTTGEYILDENGERQYDTGVNNPNMVWEIEENRNELTKNTLSGQAHAEVILPAGFSFTLKGDLYLASQERKLRFSPEIKDGPDGGAAQSYQYRFKRYTFQEQLNWKKHFGKHTPEVLLAHENYYYLYDYTALAKKEQILPDNWAMSNFTTMQGLLGYRQNYRTESYLGRLRYNYDNRYFAEVSLRRDGSSRFHPDHRWGNFGSAGVAWLLSDEEFFRNVAVVDYLKVRFSYGEVGNDASVGYYGWMSLYQIATNGGEAALYKSQIVDEDIKWETSVSYDAAVEATFFGRWNLTVEYFDKRSKDLLFDVSLPLSAGATSTDASEMASVMRNLGRVSNRGWEIATDVDIIRTASWHWNVGVNATVMKNKILTLPPDNREAGIEVAGKSQKYMEGHSIYEWWLPCFAGVDRLTGNSLYLPDLETYYAGDAEDGKKPMPKAAGLVHIGDRYYITNPSYARKDWCGSALPKMYGSFSTRLAWKGLSLSALWTYSIGGKIYDQSYASLMTTGTSPRALHRDILSSWDGAPEGMREDSPDRLDPQGIPVINSALSVTNNATSSRFLVDGSYLWVKNMTVAYSLPVTLVRKLDLQAVSLNASLENVALFTKRKGMNPQQSFTGLSEDVLVAPRVLSIGLTIKL